MEYFIIALLVISLILLLLFLTRVRINFRYARIGRNDELVIKVCLLKGILCYRFKLPFVKIEKKRNGLVMKVRALLEGKRGRELKKEEEEMHLPELGTLMRMFSNFLNLLIMYLPIIRCLLEKTQIRKLSWRTEIGAGDPFYTGIAAGAAWSLKGALLSAFYRQLSSGAVMPEVAVRPNFVNSCFNTAFECIFEIRIGHIMLTGIKALLLRFKRPKKTNRLVTELARTASNRGINENRHGEYQRDGRRKYHCRRPRRDTRRYGDHPRIEGGLRLRGRRRRV